MPVLASLWTLNSRQPPGSWPQPTRLMTQDFDFILLSSLKRVNLNDWALWEFEIWYIMRYPNKVFFWPVIWVFYPQFSFPTSLDNWNSHACKRNSQKRGHKINIQCKSFCHKVLRDKIDFTIPCVRAEFRGHLAENRNVHFCSLGPWDQGSGEALNPARTQGISNW